ncbi:MAG TPA: hypothetical protein VEL74_09420 [Thermoanaerobaculia bacterium]|nr:hypothetical protein [Thermoanaerobaculia bacterium]
MASLSFAEELNLNTLLTNNLRSHLGEMPHLTGLHNELEGLVSQGRLLEDQRGFYEGQLRHTNAQRRELEKKGRELRQRLASALRSSFGLDNQKLLEFGVKPRAVRRRRPKPDEPVLEDRADAQ